MSTRDSTQSPALLHFFLVAASIVIIIAGMRAAQSLLVPFIIATFVAVISMPPLKWMQRKGVPTPLAMLIMIVVLLAVGLGLVALVGRSLETFLRNSQTIEENLVRKEEELVRWLAERGVNTPNQRVLDLLDPRAAVRFVAGLVNELVGMLGHTVIIAITVIFMLLEASHFDGKLRLLTRGSPDTVDMVGDILMNVRRYMMIKTATSLLTGVMVAGWLLILGVEFAPLWGLLAFLLNYVPNIGSIIAAVPPVVLALTQAGAGTAGAVAIGYLLVNCTISYLIEPRFMGRGLGLSVLVVFLSLVFWGFVLGPTGMFLSAPLTMVVKIVFQSMDETRWLAILMGSNVPDGLSNRAIAGRA